MNTENKVEGAMGAVDCATETNLCKEQEVKGYPTCKYFFTSCPDKPCLVAAYEPITLGVLATLETRRRLEPKCAPQLFVGSLLRTRSEVFAKVNSAQFPSCLESGEFWRYTPLS